MNRVCLTVGLSLLFIFSFGCSGSKGLKVNISEGEYYSEDEYAELSSGEKEAYCQALAKELTLLKRSTENKQSELEATNEKMEKLKSELAPLESDLLKINSDIRTLKQQIDELESLPKTWTIKPGECLWIIAGYEEVYSDPIRWPRLFRANLDVIEDPDYIYPDTVLAIPRDWPREHRVATDECLWIIAGYWEIYDSPLEWTKIFEANRDQIKDPDLIIPKQVLTIPR